MHYRFSFHGYRAPGLLMVVFLTSMVVSSTVYGVELTINEATRLALLSDPVIASSQARSQSMQEAAVAAGQLSDPTLKTGLYNLPIDDFDVEKQPTTQLRLGFVQAFSRGDSLRLRQQQGEWLATAEDANTQVIERQLIRDVRNTFLELYYQLHARDIVNETRSLFAELVDVTEIHYGTGRVSQQDLLQASLELSRLDDRRKRISNEIDKGRIALAQWLADEASLTINTSFPTLPPLSTPNSIKNGLSEHPLILMMTAKLEASNQKVSIAREQYKPGWSVGIEYRKRFGEERNGNNRSDMIAAMATVNLPLFTGNRQDKRLSADLHEADSIRLKREDALRLLTKQLNTEYSDWKYLGERSALYESQILSDAAANATASLNAYQAGVTEFPSLIRARITDLDVRLDELRLRIDRTKAHANLLYLSGEPQ